MVYQIRNRLKSLYTQLYSEIARWLSRLISARIPMKTTVSFRLLRLRELRPKLLASGPTLFLRTIWRLGRGEVSHQGAERKRSHLPTLEGVMVPQLIDAYERKFYYLRLSITDVCNFRCTYCLPDGYRPNGSPKTFLSLDEIRRVSRAFAELGTEKVRLTGGEPSLRRDFTEIIAAVRENPAIRQLAVTTNGYRMARDVAGWRDAGLTAVNVSVDSLDPRQFHAITGQDKFRQVMDGIDAAFTAGFSKVKVNAVLMRDVNHQQLGAFLNWIKDRPIQLRFIELMETGEGGDLFRKHHVSGEVIRLQLEQQGWQRQPRGRSDGPAQVFSHPDYQGEVGLIMPYEKDFCASCNRLRVSAIGNLHLCLFGEQGIGLRDLLTNDQQLDELKDRIQGGLLSKKQTHFLHQGNSGITQNLSFIGG
jgi:cyclic pyranopterin phosphate synthase